MRRTYYLCSQAWLLLGDHYSTIFETTSKPHRHTEQFASSFLFVGQTGLNILEIAMIVFSYSKMFFLGFFCARAMQLYQQKIIITAAISNKNEFQKETFLFRSTSNPVEFSPIDNDIFILYEFFVAAFTKRMYPTLPKLKYYSKRL